MLAEHIPVHKKVASACMVIVCMLTYHQFLIQTAGAGPILSCLAPDHQHYLSVPDPPTPGNGLGTAVVRIGEVGVAPCACYSWLLICLSAVDDVGLSHKDVTCSPVTDTPHSVECSATMNSSHTVEDSYRMESQHSQLELAEPVVKAKETGTVTAVFPKRRVPNTVVCVVKAGRLWISLKVRCARYLSTLKKSAGFRVRLVGVSSVGRVPWNLGHSALSYRLRLMPMATIHKCKSAPVKVSTKRTTTQELCGDDIDDIFSALV